jgi:hypothetical protein
MARLGPLVLLVCACGPPDIPSEVYDAYFDLSSSIGGWGFDGHASGGDAYYPARAWEAAKPIKDTLTCLSAAVSATMLAKGGQGGGSLRQPTAVDAQGATWTRDGKTVQLNTNYDPPRAWKLSAGAVELAHGYTGAHSSMQVDPVALGCDTFSDVVHFDFVPVPNREVMVTYMDGATQRSTHVLGDLDHTDTSFSFTDERMVQHSVRARTGSSGGGATATLTGGPLGSATVTAKECWMIDGSRIYYEDSGGVKPKVGSVAACIVAPPP